MNQKSFYMFITKENIPFVESNFYLNSPGIYGIIIYPDRYTAYKNYQENEINQSPTEWAKECNTIEDAYTSIYDYILLNKNNDKIK